MTTIFSGLDIARQSLNAQQYALSITQRNIANANNPAYTREDVLFTSDWIQGAVSGAPGVLLSATRDRYVDYGISQELQSLGEYSVTYDELRQIDAILNGTGGQGLQQALSDFFNSFSELSGSPESISLRQQVLSSANALATEFHRLYSGIQQVQVAEDNAVAYTVDEINAITSKIAALNEQIKVAHGTKSENEFTLRDERQQLLEQLSGLIDMSYFETESGSVTVTTRQGGTLVLEDQSHVLECGPSTDNAFRSVFLDGADITDTLGSGKLGGLIDLRDNKIADYLNSLDDMAAAIIERVNEQHAAGSDLGGSAGGDFFVPFVEVVPGSSAGAARSIGVALTDPRQVAAAAAGSGPGNNENAKLLAAISDEPLLSSSTETVSQSYAKLIYRIGSDESTAEEGITTQNNVLEQLRNQRDAFSGVNLDEEAVNIIKYQKAYEASAKYASVLNDLSDEVLAILGV